MKLKNGSKNRTKLQAVIFALVLLCSCCLTAFVTLALVTERSFDVGGSLSFVATGVNAEITKGSTSGLTIDEYADMETLVYSTKSAAVNTGEAKKLTWTGLTVTPSAQTSYFTFTIENTGSSGDLYTKISLSDSYDGSNLSIKITADDGTDDISGKQQTIGAGETLTVTITFTVSDTNYDAITDFAITVRLSNEEIGYTLTLYIYDVDTPENNTTAKAFVTEDTATATVLATALSEAELTDTVDDTTTCGWFTDEACTTEADLTGDLTDNINLYTKYATSDKLVFTTSDTTASVKASSTSIDGEVVIPKIYKVGETKYTVTAVAEGGFEECYDITSVTIPSSVTSIGTYTFMYCTSLTSLSLSANITSIGVIAFAGCSLESITVDSGNEVYYSDGNCIIERSSNTIIQGCNNSVIPSDGSVEIIGMGAFAYLTITSIDIPSGITTIDYRAFLECYYLTSITIPSSVTSIGEFAFGYCTGLTTINYNATSCANLSSESCVFYCAGQSSDGITVYVGDNVTSIPAYLFYASYDESDFAKITSVVFEENSQLTSIEECAFLYCLSLTSITIPEKVTNIGDGAFFCCTGLTTIYYNATSCGDLSSSNQVFAYAGQSGDGITVYVGDNVTSIPAYLFYPYNDSSFSPKITSVVFSDNSELTSIGTYAFYNCSSLTGVYITDIDAWVQIEFENSYANPLCNAGNLYLDNVLVTEVTLSSSVTAIGAYAFYNYTKLTSITIPEKVNSIGNYAFGNCTGLTTINYNATSCGDLSSANCVFYCAGQSGDGITVYVGGNVKSIPAYLLNPSGGSSYSPKITSVVFGENSQLTSIGSYAFEYCSSLTSITIPEKVTSIGDYAFYGCHKLVEVYNLSELEIKAGDTGNGYVAYYALAVYTDTSTESKVTTTNDYIFYVDESESPSTYYLIGYTGSDTELTLPTSINGNEYEIYQYAFYGNINITSVDIPENVTSIGTYAFNGCTSLTSITIPESVTSIGNYAFYNCTGLTTINYNATACANLIASNYVFYKAGQSGDGITVYVGDNVTSIPAYLFYPYSVSSYSPKITSVVFGENSKLTSIGTYAFYYCTSLTSVDLSNCTSLTSIGDYAYNYSGLTSITIPASVTSIGDYAFRYCESLTRVYISDIDAWAQIKFENSYANPLYYAGNLYLDNVLVTEVTLSDSVTAIGSYAFYNYTKLTSITIPASVTSIGTEAFYNCTKLTTIYYNATACANLIASNYVFYCAGQSGDGITVYVGGNVKSIPAYLLNPSGSSSYSPKITSVIFEENSQLESIENYAFRLCTSLKSVDLSNCTSLKYIGAYAFRYCSNLTSITIPESVTSIGTYAFDNAGLTTVYYGGTADEWSAITIGTNNTNLTSATIYYYSATEPSSEESDTDPYYGDGYTYWHYNENNEIEIWVQATE